MKIIFKKIWRMVVVTGTIMILGGIGALVFTQSLLPKLANHEPVSNWKWVKQVTERTTVVKITEEIVVRPDDAMRSVTTNARPAIVYIISNSDRTKAAQMSTGIVISSDGVIAAQLPVALPDSGTTYTILTAADKAYDATLTATDNLTGITFLRIADVTNLPVVTFMRGDDIFLTQSVVAIGATSARSTRASVSTVGDVQYDRTFAVTKSLSSNQLTSTISMEWGEGVMIGDVIFNSRAELMGMIAGSADARSVVSVNAINDAWQRLLADKLTAQSSLGVEYVWLSPTVTAVRGLQRDNGMLVTKVAKGSTAARGGLYVGDIITMVGEQLVDNSTDNSMQLAWILRNYQQGDVVSIQILRSGQEKSLLVSL